jgi:hypothetical protein
VQRCSSSIANLAAALARAQAELVNPEKSLVATIALKAQGVRSAHFAMRPYRLGSTSYVKP